MKAQENEYELILSNLYKMSGFDFSQYREGTIRRRLARRMAVTGTVDYRGYLEILEGKPQEYGCLLEILTIKVSRFFRNHHVFEKLREELFPDLFRQKEEERTTALRIWCAGCAFGEEVYSVAISLMSYLEEKGENPANYDITLFGTDIDDETLEKARLGIYGKEAVKEVKQEILDTYFLAEKDRYRLKESIKSLVSFTLHDLTSKKYLCPPAGVVANYDLILCRNTLIYFSAPLQERVFTNLYRSLNRGGYLILGKSESVPKHLENLFVLDNRKNRIYQKK